MSFNEDWEKVQMKDICNITSSKRIYRSEYKEKGIPFYRSKEIIKKFNNKTISDNLYISKERYNEISQKYDVPKEGEILLTSVGTLGIPYLIKENEEFYFKDGNLTWFKDFEETVSSEYIYYWLQSNLAKRQIKAITIGSTQQALTITALNKLDIKLPNYELQKSICNFIKFFDKKIENNNKINKSLEEMAQAIYKSWFVDFEPFQEEELKKGKLKEIINITLGNSPKSDTYNEEGEGLPLLNGAGDFKDGFPTQSRYSSNPKRIAKEGEMLLCTRGTIGHVSFADTDYCIGRGVSSMRPKDEIYNEYVNLTVKYYLEKLKQGAAGSVIKGLTKSDMLNIPILKTNMEHFEKFHKILNPIFKKKMINRKENQSLKELRDSLLPKLMSGEIRVPIDEDVKEVN